MRFLRGFFLALAWIAGGLVALALIGLAVAVWIWRDIPAERLEARYATEASRFAEIDGARIHYRDEGQGPAVVLIHANFASLIGWDPWVDALKDRYRVVRFDMTSHGLTGADATGDYGLPRTVDLMERLLEQLGVERCAIVGTSLGGTVAMHYTVRNPERVAGLVLISPGSLEPDVRGRQAPARMSPARRAGALDHAAGASRIHAEDRVRRPAKGHPRTHRPLARPVAAGRSAHGAA